MEDYLTTCFQFWLERSELDSDLLQAAGNVGRAMAAFVNKVDASIHPNVRMCV